MSLTRTPGNEPPEGLVTGHFLTSDGLRLRFGVSRVAHARGTVVVLQGRGDFFERYLETFRDLNAMGYAAASFDFRGQGASPRLQADPLRSNVPDFKLYDEDLASFMKHQVLPDCTAPFYLIGHSMGGCVALRALQKHNWFSRAVLTSPMLDVNTGRWPKPMARFIATFLTLLGFGDYLAPGRPGRPLGPDDFYGNDLTGDKLRYDRDQRVLQASPGLGIGGATLGWLRGAFAAMRTLSRLPEGTMLLAPTLIVAAGRERVTVTEACRDFARRVVNVSFVIIGESRHEILMEKDAVRAQFWAAFESFVSPPR
ncbi:MAG: alpha/beta hydrolase [Aestuariivirgaceae bacterium]|nr:alpha/beta hydrolase [Aestuariivirgaceae bacterium]